jgi:Tfp pilus assembly protein PilO
LDIQLRDRQQGGPVNTFIDSLNLRPAEKRIIVVIAVVAFVVLDLLFVQPQFKAYGNIKRQLDLTRQAIANRSAMIEMDNNPTNGYKRQLEQLRKGEGNSSATNYSGEIQLQTTVHRKAVEAGVNVSQYDPVNLVHLGTNAASQFFESQSIRISVEAREENLVNFLYSVGNDPAMIRVRELDLKPVEPNRYQLKGMITLTADYKKSDKAAATKLVPAKTLVLPKNAAKTPGPVPPKTGAPPGPPPNARGQSAPSGPPSNARGPAAPGQRAPNARGPAAPGQRAPNARGPAVPGQRAPNARGSSASAPPPFPVPSPSPPAGQKPADAGNNQ